MAAKLLILTFSAFFFGLTPAQAQSVGDFGVVSSSDGELNLRSGPSTDTRILRVLRNGENVEVLERSTKWARVRNSRVGAGWVYVPLLAFSDKSVKLRFKSGDTALVCNAEIAKTNVRYGPSAKDYGILATLRNGHPVEVRGVKYNSGGFAYYEITFKYPGEIKRGAGYIYHNALKSRCGSKSASTLKKAPVKPNTNTTSGNASKLLDSSLTLDNGSCAVVVASRRTESEVLSFFLEMDRWKDSFSKTRRAYLARNGWYAVTLGTVPKDEFSSKWKPQLQRRSPSMPRDFFCSTRTTFVKSMSKEALEREISAKSKSSQRKPLRPKPSFKTTYVLAADPARDKALQSAFERFAKFWSHKSGKNTGRSTARLRMVRVDPQYRTPSGLEWCQFEIATDRRFYREGYLESTRNSQFYVDAVALGAQSEGSFTNMLNGGNKTMRERSGVLNLTTSRAGFSIKSCKNVMAKGSYAAGTSNCVQPQMKPYTQSRLKIAYESYAAYVELCAAEYGKHITALNAEQKRREDEKKSKAAQAVAAAAQSAPSERYRGPGLMLEERQNLLASGRALLKQGKREEAARHLHTALVKGARAAKGPLEDIYIQDTPRFDGTRQLPKVTAYRLGADGEAGYVSLGAQQASVGSKVTSTRPAKPKPALAKPKPTAPAVAASQPSVVTNQRVAEPLSVPLMKRGDLELALQPLVGGDANLIKFSTEGSYIVSVPFNGALHIWEASTGTRLRVLGEKKGGNIRALRWHSDTLLRWYRNDTLFEHDVISGQTTAHINLFGEQENLRVLEFDEDIFLVTSRKEGLKVYTRGNTQAHQIVLDESGSNARSAELDAQSRWFVAEADKGVYFYGSIDDAQAKKIDLSDKRISASVVDFAGKRLIFAVGERLQAFDMQTGAMADEDYTHPKKIDDLAIASNGKVLAIDDRSSTPLVLSGQSFAPFQTLEPTSKITYDDPESMDFSPNGQVLAVWNTGLQSHLWPAGIVNWSKRVSSFDAMPTVLTTTFEGLKGLLVSRRGVQQIDPQTGRPIGAPQALDGLQNAKQIAASAASNLVAYNTRKEELQVADMRTGMVLFTSDPLKGDTLRTGILRLAFSPDGDRLVSSAIGLRASVWDTTTRTKLVDLGEASTSASKVQFSADGKRVITVSEKAGAHVWDAVSGAHLWNADVDTRSVFLSADGKTIIAGREFIAQGDEAPKRVPHLRGQIHSVLSADGRWVYAVTEDKDVLRVDLMDEEKSPERINLGFLPGWIQGISFSGSGELLIVKHKNSQYFIMDRTLKPLWQMQNSTTAMVLTDTSRKMRFSPESMASELVFKVENGVATSLSKDEHELWVLE